MIEGRLQREFKIRAFLQCRGQESLFDSKETSPEQRTLFCFTAMPGVPYYCGGVTSYCEKQHTDIMIINY